MNSMTYVLYSEDIDYCILIDCGEYDTLEPVLKQIGKKVKAVLLTHGHSDHIWGLNYLLNEYPTLLIGTNEEGHKELGNSKLNLSFFHEQPYTVENYEKIVLRDNQVLHFDGLCYVKVLATPGHSPSCLSYEVDRALFTGDSYVPEMKVYNSFPRSNKELSITSYKLLESMEKQGFVIYCGHHSYI